MSAACYPCERSVKAGTVRLAGDGALLRRWIGWRECRTGDRNPREAEVDPPERTHQLAKVRSRVSNSMFPRKKVLVRAKTEEKTRRSPATLREAVHAARPRSDRPGLSAAVARARYSE